MIIPDFKSVRQLTMTLERTACFGECPVYKLKVDGKGNVTYVGELYVKVVGKKRAKISLDKVQELFDAFFKVDYFSLDDEYSAMVTDMPSAITSITMDGKFKQVADEGRSGPQELVDLEDKIDEITNSQKWTVPYDAVADAAAKRKSVEEYVKEILPDLKPQEQEILKKRVGLEDGLMHGLDALCKEFGVSRIDIRKIEEKAFGKIKERHKDFKF